MTEEEKSSLLNILRDSKNLLKDEIQQKCGDFVVKKLEYEDNNPKIEGFMVLSDVTYKKDDIKNLDSLGNYKNKHRYYYYEKLNDDANKKKALFIMFNPSKANPKDDDQTIKNCRKLLKNKNQDTYEYKSMEIINLFSERNPIVNLAKFNKNNSLNKIFIEKYLENINEHVDIILAWGYGKENKCAKYIETIKNTIKSKNFEIKYIKINADNANKNIHHPASRAWSGMGKFEEIAELETYTIK